MTPESSLIITPLPPLPPIQLSPEFAAEMEAALASSALIGKVDGIDSKTVAVRAQQSLKAITVIIEKSRKREKESCLERGRAIDNFCNGKAKPFEDELERIGALVGAFDDTERERVKEEERLQRLELERIEREKQAELERIAREQREREEAARKERERIESEQREAVEAMERKARQEREAAEKLASEATNKKQREAAEKARREAEKQAEDARAEQMRRELAAKAEQERIDAELKRKADEAARQAAAVEEKAGDATYIAAKPVEITKVSGQRTSSDWDIIVNDPYKLARMRPDLVNITPRIAEIKAALNDGQTIPGIMAKRKHTAGVMVPKGKTINV